MLREKIKECVGCNINFAIKMGMSEHTLSLKLNNKADFKQSQIELACKLLEIPREEIYSYFFTKEVAKK